MINNKSFDEYWDEFHKIENLSMKESIRQKKERETKSKNKKDRACRERDLFKVQTGQDRQTRQTDRQNQTDRHTDRHRQTHRQTPFLSCFAMLVSFLCFPCGSPLTLGGDEFG